MLITRIPREYEIGCVNWPEVYPYRPQVSVEASCSGAQLHLHFKVKEDAVAASCEEDGGAVYKDSCVEFFFAPSDDGLYYNMECSCIGRILLCCGPDRFSRESLTEEAYRGIRRRSSLGSSPFALREGPVEWELELDIPASTFVHHDIADFGALEAKGNFYKCGDSLPTRHYLSLFPVRTEKPDFHRPEFFDSIRFE